MINECKNLNCQINQTLHLILRQDTSIFIRFIKQSGPHFIIYICYYFVNNVLSNMINCHFPKLIFTCQLDQLGSDMIWHSKSIMSNQSQTWQFLKIKMLNGLAWHYRTAISASLCGVCCVSWTEFLFEENIFSIERKLWKEMKYQV